MYYYFNPIAHLNYLIISACQKKWDATFRSVLISCITAKITVT